MDKYYFSRNQLLALCTLCFLVPALRLFPASSAEIADRASWLAAPAALPLLLVYVYFLSKLMDCCKEGQGLGELSLSVLGNKGGKIFLWAFALWFLLYGGFVLRTGADRLITTIYPYTSSHFFVISLGIVCSFAAMCPARTLVRTAKLVLPAVLGFLFLILLFALLSVDRSNLLPVSVYDILPVFKASFSSVNVCVGVLYSACFLGGMVKNKDGRFKAYALWLSFSCIILCFLNMAITGCFGADLTGRLSRPFFALVRSIVFFRTVERVEALMVSLWLFPDFLMVALVLFCAQFCIRLSFGKQPKADENKAFDLRNGRWVIPLCGLAAILLGLFIAPEPVSLDIWSEQIIPYMNLGFAFLVLPIIYIVGKIKKQL